MRYNVRTGRWHGRKPTRTTPDPYSPDSAGYTKRNQLHVHVLPGGLIREDKGERIPL